MTRTVTVGLDDSPESRAPAERVAREARLARTPADASHDASPAVAGRRIRTSPLRAHSGHVTRAVPHHVVAPVAVVGHD
ncbi:hypothetical protein [Streptomyces sp. NPDC001851]|uniref:hypothetical protein n=1 Tax=Streptomyces sp. NPDC001851 TaxID=3154529 RepID=UPI0033319248